MGAMRGTKGKIMRLNHHQFEAFAYVVREGSFSAAAPRQIAAKLADPVILSDYALLL
ncbi:hypothetical protein N8090_03440 [Amylibacter sp.]|jgi:hypothetical protein|nr:hypothetical protein [Amylibacter sp.]MDC0607239.1 hypothetical protein [Amylibacter sp.]MDC1446306.1 hypothetical protein [Amylibacter sp.]MDC1489384.1 hypothetical protein [Amylibacter sp.]